MNRRSFVQLTGGAIAVATLAGCNGVPGGRDPDDPTRTTPTSPTTPTTPTTMPEPGARVDGNVIREYDRVGAVVIAVVWRRPQGDAQLALRGAELVLDSAHLGTRTLAAFDLDVGEGSELVARTLGPSVLQEARVSLAVATGA